MNFHLYQLIILLVAVFMVYQGISGYIKGKDGQTFYKALIRIIVWGGMAIIAIFPSVTFALAKIIGLEGNINAVILTGFLLVFLMIFKLLSAIERLEQNMSELTRKESLSNLSVKK